MTAAQWREVFRAEEDAQAHVAMGVTFLHRSVAQATDPLYGEASGGTTAYVPYADVKASVREKPSEEYMTRIGLRDQADLVLWVTVFAIEEWTDALDGRTFVLKEDMQVTYRGITYELVHATPIYLPAHDVADVLRGWLVSARLLPR